MIQRPTWRKIIAALVCCGAIACSEQVFPQLVAQLASLDHDHGISLRACDDGVDLILTHDHHAFPQSDEFGSLALAASQPSHVFHFMAGLATAKQATPLIASNHSDVTIYFSTALITEWRTFVPPMALAYSRPPPDEISILPEHRSTQLLI